MRVLIGAGASIATSFVRAEYETIVLKDAVKRPTLQQEVDELREKVAKLESDKSSPAFRAPAIQLSGFVDVTYNYNTNSPKERTSVGRVFDRDANNFSVNAVKLSAQTNVDDETPVGVRADLYVGQDAKLIHSAGLGESNDSFDLKQAYVNYHKGYWDFKAGKFVTLAGAEVIESKDNWNVSRGLLFGYAIPFTHTGVRGTYATDGWDFVLGVNNGWDVATDNNSGKTIETHVGVTGIELPSDSSLNVSWNGYFGPENANDNTQRSLSDTVLVYKTPWKPLTLMYNFDYAKDSSLATWYGHAGYIRVDLNDDWSFSLRGEHFNDEDGVRLGTADTKYNEGTGTLEYRATKSVTTRLEYRADHASEAVFNGKGEDKKNSQGTVAGEVIVSF